MNCLACPYLFRFLRKTLGDVVAAMLHVARADSLEPATRSLAMEFMVTLCDARDKAPGMMRKLPNFVNQLFETLMLFLLDIEVRLCTGGGEGVPGCGVGMRAMMVGLWVCVMVGLGGL